jgi:hypothetical protein
MDKKNETAIVQTDGFGETSLAQVPATMSEVLAKRAEAEINACYIMAERHPRDWSQVRKELLESVERPGFAGLERRKVDGAAWYSIPMGKGKPVQGFSIRFAEEVIRAMHHIDANSVVIWESDLERMVEVKVVDFQTNTRHITTVVVEKTVERSFFKDDDVVLSKRVNTQGKPVYLRKATEDEVLKKQNSLISKAIRNGVLRLLPGDIQAECKDRILEIRNGRITKDPKAFQKKIADSFTKIGVSPKELIAWLGHSLSSCSPAELNDLKDLHEDIRDGKTTWADVIKSADEEPQETKAEPKPKKQESKIVDVKPVETSQESYELARKNLELYAQKRFGQKWQEALANRITGEGYAGIEEMTDSYMIAMTDDIKKELNGYE